MNTEGANTNIGSSITTGDRSIVVGSLTVGGDVEGGIHIHAGAETQALRPIPPAPPPHFTGRETELDRLAQLLTSGEPVATTALQGMGGIGKTALAQKLAERVKDAFPGGVLWWSLGPQANVFGALDVWARHVDPRSDLKDFPDAESCANVVRSMLSRLGRLLAIIDDVWQAGAARTLMSSVPPGCPILITSRDGDVAKALHCRIERIDTLSEDEAVALLTKLLGPPGECEPAARETAKLTEGLPLALELIAGLADSPADLAALAQKLARKPGLDILKLGGGEKREESVEACLALSYSALDPDVQRRFRALGVFAPAPFDRDAIAAVWGDDDDERAEQAVRHLTRRNLLSLAKAQKPSQGYRQHALLRAYALALLRKEGEFDDIAARYADYYRRFAEEKDWRAVENAFDQIDWAWRWVRAHSADQIIDYAFAVGDFLNIRGRKVEAIDWLQTGLERARVAQNLEQEGTFLNNIGQVYSDLGQTHQALEVFQQALAILREVGDRLGEGATLNNIAGVYYALGQTQQALDTLQQALSIRREAGDRLGEGTTLNNIAGVYSDLGQKQQALDTYQQALAIAREVGDRGGEGTTLNNIAAVYDALGQKQQALEAYQHALAIHREVGNRPMEGTTLSNIGQVYSALGQQQQALDTFQQALTIRREVGDRGGEGTTLNNIAGVYYDLGQQQQALEAYQQALTILREVGDRWSESVLLSNIGARLDDMGRTAEAVGYLEQNVALDEAIGHPDLERDRAKLEEMREKMRAADRQRINGF